jgi:hypothetical protein
MTMDWLRGETFQVDWLAIDWQRGETFEAD